MISSSDYYSHPPILTIPHILWCTTRGMCSITGEIKLAVGDYLEQAFGCFKDYTGIVLMFIEVSTSRQFRRVLGRED